MALTTTTGTITKGSVDDNGEELFTVTGEPPPDPNEKIFKVSHDKQSKYVVVGDQVTVTHDDAAPEPVPVKVIRKP